MTASVDPQRIRAAWAGRISGCILGKPVEVLSFREGVAGLRDYLLRVGALPLRDYVPLEPGSLVERLGRACCLDHISRAEPDDDLNYTLLALLMLEQRGLSLDIADVARAWLNHLPAGTTWTAERAAYRTLLEHMDAEFVNGAEPGFDLSRCSDNDFNTWIGAQIRADLYGWVCPGNPPLAAKLAATDASLSHRDEGVHAAMFIAALGAALPVSSSLDTAIDTALAVIPPDSGAADAVRLGRSAMAEMDAVTMLHEAFVGFSPVYSLNNLALVVWALVDCGGDFSRAIGSAVSAGWDTDCNGATVGALCGLAGYDIPGHWTAAWRGRVAFTLAGIDELSLDELTGRTVAVAENIRRETLH